MGKRRVRRGVWAILGICPFTPAANWVAVAEPSDEREIGAVYAGEASSLVFIEL